jgi:hypothetical protein
MMTDPVIYEDVEFILTHSISLLFYASRLHQSLIANYEIAVQEKIEWENYRKFPTYTFNCFNDYTKLCRQVCRKLEKREKKK